MKHFVLTMVVLAGLVVLLGAWFVASGTHSPPDCPRRLFTVAGADGEPLECVCAEGALATCFKPGP